MQGRFALRILAAVSFALLAGCNQGTAPVSQNTVAPTYILAKASGIPANPAWDHAAAAQHDRGHSLFSIPGVVGTGLSIDADDRPVIVVFTAQPGVRGLPSEVEGVPVVVEVSGTVVALKPPPGGGGGGGGGCLADPKARWTRPVPIGVSIGHPLITAGTLGARVKDAFGNVFALSNNHVLAASNAGVIGDMALQPGPYDGGTAPTDAFGNLSDFQPLAFCDAAGVCPANRIDAAIAATTTTQVGNATPCNGYGTPKSAAAIAVVRMKVKKYGRTTGLTSGNIFALNVSIKVSYGPDALGADQVALFTGQVYVNKAGFSAGGDSGSLIVSDAGNPVALLFAGGSSSTIGNPIGEVLARFGVSVDGN